MWYQGIVPARVLLIPVLIMTTKGTHQQPKNDSNARPDVIVTYSNHAEASDINQKILVATEKSIEHTITTKVFEYSTEMTTPERESSEVEEPLQDDILFVPNDEEVIRNEDYLLHPNLNIQDLMQTGHKTVADIISGKNVKVETEPPNTDIIFVMGKNNENLEKPAKEKSKNRWSYEDTRHSVDISTPSPKLDCSNLTCNNTIKSVCGGKIENYQWRYRLFLNECYFRKVNCNFKNAINRFKQVTLDNCKNIGAHKNQTPFSFKPPQKFDIKPVQVNNTRRSSPSSRRSMTMSMNGQFCSHPCPASCPEQYAPECAVSGTGRHRVFVNHCALDYNSCSFGIVWHSRPLSECVGGKKADMRQNAGFIGWMQQVGIVDKRGRLVLA